MAFVALSLAAASELVYTFAAFPDASVNVITGAAESTYILGSMRSPSATIVVTASMFFILSLFVRIILPLIELNKSALSDINHFSSLFDASIYISSPLCAFSGTFMQKRRRSNSVSVGIANSSFPSLFSATHVVDL